jgi:hypothetical protein
MEKTIQVRLTELEAEFAKVAASAQHKKIREDRELSNQQKQHLLPILAILLGKLRSFGLTSDVIPVDPEKAYPDDWKGWNDCLGIDS